MGGILADINVQGHAQLLLRIVTSEYWQEVWTSLALPVYTFAEVGLPREATDLVVWQLCQQREQVLITANRNKKGTESLEATIQAYNTPTCLPVFTLANAGHLRQSREYAERVAARFLELLEDIEKYRGTGRLYLP